MKNRVSETLNMLHQEHIVSYMKSLLPEEQLSMTEQINRLDLSVLNTEKAKEERGFFEPLYAMRLDEIKANRQKFTETGFQAIRNGKVGLMQ